MTVPPGASDALAPTYRGTGEQWPGRPDPPRLMISRPRWQDEGEEPDYRFSLANERTFLGWLRTALALMAGAIAVSQLVPEMGLAGGRTVLGAALATAGTALPAVAYRRWARYQRAMRHGQPLPPSPMLLVVAAAGTVLGLLILGLLAIAGFR